MSLAFDSDHVCGLELLLERFRIGTLVLPYLHLADRLQLAIRIREERTFNAGNVAALIANPVRYVYERDYGSRIEKIVLVQGSEPAVDDGADEALSEDLEQRGQGEVTLALEIPAGWPGSGTQEYGSSATVRGPKVMVTDHRHPWRVGNAYEFLFYNTALPNGKPIQSGATLAEVVTEVDRIVDDFELVGRRIPRPGWRKALRRAYDRHFGAHATRRNRTSLCVYGRPTPRGPVSDCGLFKDEYSGNPVRLMVRRPEASAIQLTGDICLNRRALDQLRRHVRAGRWGQIGMMQIPHHGSRDNWQSGNSAYCSHDYSVICSQLPRPGGRHPHREVLIDLAEVAIASYERGVCLDYHLSR